MQIIMVKQKEVYIILFLGLVHLTESREDNDVILSILFILAMLAMTGAIAYFSIGHAVKANKQYELFAQKYGYQFDKARQ